MKKSKHMAQLVSRKNKAYRKYLALNETIKAIQSTCKHNYSLTRGNDHDGYTHLCEYCGNKYTVRKL